MQTLNLRVDESFFPHFKVMLDSFVKDKKVEIIEDTFQKHLIASSVEDVRKRVFEAEQQQSVSQEEYEKLMNAFFVEELGIKR
ncbi:MAG: hypothetical protein NTZ60_09465 [Campylobacterales bacterium]|nr:hypothetical protein [Campylobacterales bacterium]